MATRTQRASTATDTRPTYGVAMLPGDTVKASSAGVDFNTVGNVGFDLTVGPTTTPAQMFWGTIPGTIAYTPGAAATPVLNVSVPNATGIWGIELTTMFQDGASDGIRTSTAQMWIQRVAGAAAVGGVASAGTFNITVGTSDAGTATWSVGTITGGTTAVNVVPLQVAFALGNAVAGTIKNTTWRLIVPGAEAVSVA